MRFLYQVMVPKGWYEKSKKKCVRSVQIATAIIGDKGEKMSFCDELP